MKKTDGGVWVANTGRLVAGPAIDHDGTAYFVTARGDFSAITLKGKQPWSKSIGTASRCTPALDASGAVYVTAKDAGLVAMTREGDKRWSVPVGGLSHPVIGPDGSVYVIDAAGVHAVSPSGREKWTYPLGASVGARDEAVAIGADGILYAVRDGLHAISPGGARLWRSDDGDALSPPPIVAAGKVFVGSGTKMVPSMRPRENGAGRARRGHASARALRSMRATSSTTSTVTRSGPSLFWTD